MSIRIETLKLIDLIADLKPTTAPDADSGAVNGILLHTERGYGFPGDPGKTDILVGTSTNRVAVGHTFVPCHGQIARPMLWPLQSAVAVVNLFKPSTKDNKDHAIEISFDGNNIHVQEDPDLFGEGTKLEFTVGDVTKFPRSLWKLLQHDHADNIGYKTEPMPRTDISVHGMLPFVTVAARHGGTMELYRWHQRRALLIQIGDRYRGALAPAHWPDDKNPQAGHTPHGDVYTPDLPPEVKDANEPDPKSLLQQAAHLAITTQLISASLLVRGMRVKVKQADQLIDQLEQLGVIAEPNGSSGTRTVLVRPDELAKVLAKIRNNEQPAEPVEAELTEEVPADG